MAFRGPTPYKVDAPYVCDDPVVEMVGQFGKTAEDFLGWLTRTLEAGTTLAIDTETNALGWWSYQPTRLVQFGTTTEAWCVAVELHGQLAIDAVRMVAAARSHVVFHNAPFDQHHLLTLAGVVIPWHRVHDTSFLLRLRNSSKDARLKGWHTASLLGRWIFNGKDALNEARDEYNFRDKDKWIRMPVTDPRYWLYGGMDTCLTAQLFEALKPTAEQFAEAYLLEREYQRIAFGIERRGVRVSERALDEAEAQLTASANEAAEALRSFGVVNPKATKQVTALLQEMGWEPEAFTPTASPKFDKEVKDKLVAHGGPEGAVAELIIQHAQAVKWRATYVYKTREMADWNGLVHPQIHTMRAKTGRSSVTGPPLQTLPKGDPLIRNLFLPPVGHKWWSLDFSNQEPRLMAVYGRSRALADLFADPEAGSVHDYVAAQMFGEGYSKAQRSAAKVFGLARPYGAEAPSLAKKARLPLTDVEAFLPEYDRVVGLDNMVAMIERALDDGRDGVYVNALDGRRLYASKADRDKQVRTLVNYLMQGGGAIQLKRVAVALDLEGYGDLMLVPVHDEMNFGLPTSGYKTKLRAIAEIMETTAKDKLPIDFPVGIEGPGKSWGDSIGKAWS